MVDINQLAELSRLAETLNKETDTYTDALAQLEKKLRKMNLGVEAWVCLKAVGTKGTPERGTSIDTMLGYAKTPDGWGFAVKDVRVENGLYEGYEDCPWENAYEQGEPKLLLKSSREVRMLAAQRIEYLLSELQTRMTEAIKSLQEARTLAERI